MKDLGLYLHIPFCRSKCLYCDFCSFPRAEDRQEDYVRALLSEMTEWSETLGARPVDTVYFGGGTPTTLPLPLFASLLEGVFRLFSIKKDAEITTECNPGTVDEAYLRALRALGVNRLSIGAQSQNDRELRLLGRIHTAADTARAVSDARRAGFDNLSLDLMLGIPAQTRESLEDTLTKTVALAPEHISAYGLKIEDGTPFSQCRDTLALPDEDTERAMYLETADFLASCGYARYEISNFARAGYESRHNLRYWTRRDYLGMGLAAHSCLGDRRFSNTEELTDYLDARRAGTEETVSRKDILAETVMLGMRLADGIDSARLEAEFGACALPTLSRLEHFVPTGLVQKKDGRFFFTSEGMLVSNTLLAEVVDFDGQE